MAKYIDSDRLLQRLTTINSTVEQGIKYYNSVYNLVNEQPSADVVEVKHGEWICLEAEIGLYCCSLCEHKILRAECNYCPNCGAKMDRRRNT